MIKKDYKTFTLQPIMKTPHKNDGPLDKSNLILVSIIVICALLFWV